MRPEKWLGRKGSVCQLPRSSGPAYTGKGGLQLHSMGTVALTGEITVDIAQPLKAAGKSSELTQVKEQTDDKRQWLLPLAISDGKLSFWTSSCHTPPPQNGNQTECWKQQYFLPTAHYQ